MCTLLHTTAAHSMKHFFLLIVYPSVGNGTSFLFNGRSLGAHFDYASRYSGDYGTFGHIMCDHGASSHD
jgi:hypothetical protein